MTIQKNLHGRLLAVLTLAFVPALSAGAQSAKLPAPACAVQRPSGVTGAPAGVAGQASAPVLYELPTDVLDGAEHILEIAVAERGTVEMRERFAFKADSEARAGRAVVEILGLHPDLRGHLQQDRAREGARLSLSVDGSFRGEETFAELSRKSAELEKQGHLSFVGIEGRSEGDASKSSIKAALTPYGCVTQCSQANQTCENYCATRPIPNCETNCDTKYTNCLHTCGCPVVISTWTTTTFVGYTLVNQPSVCLYEVINPPFNSGHYYLKYNKTYRNEHWQRIADCEGLWNDSIASVDYTTQDCYKLDPNLTVPCYFANLDVFHSCTFH